MLVGYMRVSKADGSQTVELQRDALLAAGIDAAHLYDDHASGRRDDRPGLASCLKALRDGDTLVVWKLDRLGRNLHHLSGIARRPEASQTAAIGSPRPVVCVRKELGCAANPHREDVGIGCGPRSSGAVVVLARHAR